jgi:hypothetical protein
MSLTGNTGREELVDRIPLERRITVEIDGHRIAADTVPDLYSKILAYLDESIFIEIRQVSVLPTS